MNDLKPWLEQIGLGRYAGVFAENEIDDEVLPELTDQDLRELGIPLGPRKKLLKAIAALTTDPPAVTPAPSAPAERRQLTVMFCDLVGSTALSTRLDPEDLREVIRAYQETCAKIVAGFDGFIARYMGDGLLIYFGYPQAYEDNAERAVRAALDVVETIPVLNAGIGRAKNAVLAVRIGIATGRVVVGDIIGEGASEEKAVVGETPNLAARLQGIARPNTVVIERVARTLIGELFECRDLGSQRLKGMDQTVPIWEVTGARATESRFDAVRGASHRVLVGREEEIDALLRRWQRSLAGEGQIVLLSGDPGIGKSHIVQTLDERLGSSSYCRIRCQCAPYYSNTALHPVIGQFERAAGFKRGDTPERKRDKLEQLLVRTFDAAENVAPLFAALLSIPAGNRYPTLAANPEKLKTLILDALVDYLDEMARRQPVLLIFEDVHWADPTSLELLDRLAESVARCRCLLVITFRAGFSPTWLDQAHVSLMRLNRLDPRQCAALVAQVAKSRLLPADLVEQIVAKTDGVPLFVEELTQAVLASGQIEAIPATLQDSLVARLDQAGSAKDIAQIGAVIGREFSYELLAAVAAQAGDQLQAALEKLTQSELIFRQGAPPVASYVFKHALIQEAAYEGLLRSQRQHWHAKIAAILEQQFPEQVELQPELLAFHHTAAGQAEPAVDYWRRASRRAAQRWDNLEALHHLDKALDTLSGLPDNRIRWEIQFDILLEQERLYQRRGQRDRQETVIEQLFALLKSNDDRTRLAETYIRQGDLHTLLGGFDAAERALNEALAISRDLSDPAKESKALGSLSYLRWQQSRFKESLAANQAALVIERRRADPVAIASLLINIGNDLRNLGDHQGALVHLEEALQIYEDDRETFRAELHIPATLFNIGRVYRDLGELQRALNYLRRAYEYEEKERVLYAEPYALSSMAGVYWELGETEKSLDCYQKAAQAARDVRLGPVQAQALRTLGDVLLILARPQEALANFIESTEVYADLNDPREEASVWETIAGLYENACADPQKALQAWERVHQLRLNTNDREGALAAQQQLGRLARDRGDAKSASRHLQAALALAKELADTAKQGELLNALGIAAWREQAYEDALRHYEAALALYRDAGDKARSGLMLNSLGATLRRLGRCDEALTRLQQALEANRQAQQSMQEGHALALMGDIRRDRGEPQQALWFYRKSLAIREQIGDQRGMGWMNYSQALIHKDLAQYAKARDCAAQACGHAETCADEELQRLCRRLQAELAA